MESAPRSCAAETGTFHERSSQPGQVCRNATGTVKAYSLHAELL
jgi:hypothetical protein